MKTAQEAKNEAQTAKLYTVFYGSASGMCRDVRREKTELVFLWMMGLHAGLSGGAHCVRHFPFSLLFLKEASVFDSLSFVRRVSRWGTVMLVRLWGQKVGEDMFGNCYFKMKTGRNWTRGTRVVLYAAEAEASLIPPPWFGWLHYQCEEPLPMAGENGYVTCKSHQPNLTGSQVAYRPQGSHHSAVKAWVPPAQNEDRKGT